MDGSPIHSIASPVLYVLIGFGRATNEADCIRLGL
jgi:hypothetical protein